MHKEHEHSAIMHLQMKHEQFIFTTISLTQEIMCKIQLFKFRNFAH